MFCIGCIFNPFVCTDILQAAQDGLWNKMTTESSKMEQLKEHHEKSEKEHEEFFRSTIVSEETLCGYVEVAH